MRKALLALVALLSGPAFIWSPSARAATGVEMGKDNAFKFDPAEISVPVGSTIRWENKSSIPHDVKADNGSFKSDQLSKGQTFEFTFTAPGEFRYICTVSGHEDAGMVGVVKVTGGAATPTTGASTTTTAAGGTTGTTAAAAGSTTTTTAKAAAGGSTTTTTAGGGATSTTQAPSVTPTSAPETGGVTTTTAESNGHAEEAAGGDHGSADSKEEDDEKSSPIGIAFASASTLLLVAISGKLLASKS